MSNMTKRTFLLPCLLLAACVEVPPGAYYNHGDPENLLETSSEVVTIALGSKGDISELNRILRDNPPSSAQLNCVSTEYLCSQAATILAARGVAVSYNVGSIDDTNDVTSEDHIALLYERTVARDCENRYIDNTRNNHNLPPPTMGCSVTSNMVQMVTDKKQFTNPTLMDYPDAEKAAQVYQSYSAPATAAQKSAASGQSLLSTISTSE